jgi:hypothetical protein
VFEKKTTKQTTHYMIQQLSPDCFIYLCTYLKVDDIIRGISLVCRYFEQCCQGSVLWKQIGVVPLDSIMSSGRASYVVQNYRITGINTSTVECTRQKMKRIIHLKFLEHLVTMDITEQLLYVVLGTCDKLKTLHIQGEVTGDMLNKQDRPYNALQTIRIDNNKVPRSLIEYLVSNSPNLKVFEYYSSQNILKSICSDQLQCIKMGQVTSGVAELMTEQQTKRLSHISIENGSVIPDKFLETLDQFSSLSQVSIVVSHRMKEKKQYFTTENKKVVNVELLNPGVTLLESLLCGGRFPMLQECQVDFNPSFFFRKLIDCQNWETEISLFPHLRKLHLGKVLPEVLISVLKNAPNVTSLGYSWHHNTHLGFSPSELDTMIKYSQNIQDLRLKFVKFQTEDYATVLSLSLPKLQGLVLNRINLYRPVPSTNRTTTLTQSNLETVSIIGATGTKKEWQHLLATSPRLKYLEIEDCEMNSFYKECPEDISVQFNYVYTHTKSGLFPRLNHVRCRLVNKSKNSVTRISASDIMVAALWFIQAQEFHFVNVNNEWNPVDFRAEISVKLEKFCPHLNKNSLINDPTDAVFKLFQAMLPDILQRKRVICYTVEQQILKDKFQSSASVKSCVKFICDIIGGNGI